MSHRKRGTTRKQKLIKKGEFGYYGGGGGSACVEMKSECH